MVIREQVWKQVDSMEEGFVFTASHFNVPRKHYGALVKALNHYERVGILRRLSKGRYYKPVGSPSGEVPLSEAQVLKDLFVRDGKAVGYLTGARAFARLGLTTQVTNVITIGANVRRRPFEIGPTRIEFLMQPNAIRKAEVPLLVMLDALRLIREIPAATPDGSITRMVELARRLTDGDKRRLLRLSMAYRPYVRAQLGAMFESAGLQTGGLRESLNPATRYNLGISPSCLPAARDWNIF